MKSSPGKKSGMVSVRAFEQALETRLAAGKTHANQQKLAAARLGPTPETKRRELEDNDESQGRRASSSSTGKSPMHGVRFGGVQGPTSTSSATVAAHQNKPSNSAPAWVTGAGSDDGGGSDDDDDDEAYFKALAQKAKSGKEAAPGPNTAPSPQPRPVLKNPYGVLKSSKPTLISPPQAPAAPSEAKKEATTTPFLEMFAAQYKQEEKGGESWEGESEEEDSSGSEESDDSDAAQAKPPSHSRAPAPSAKANTRPAPANNSTGSTNKLTPTTSPSDNNSSGSASSADTTLASLLQSSFLSLGSPSTSGGDPASSTFSAPSFSAPFTTSASSWTSPSSFFSPSPTANPAPSPADTTSAHQAERSVTTIAAPSFLDLFMGNPNPANNAPLPMAATAPAAPVQGDYSSSALALSSPFDLLRSAFGSDGSTGSGGGSQTVTAVNAAQLRAANGGSVRGSNGGRAQRERTAKELAAEAVKLEQKEASRAAIAAKVAAEAKAKLDAAAAAQQDEVAARAAANAAAEAAQEASQAAIDAAERAQSLAIAAAAAVGKQEADVASHVQPHAALTDAALRSIALQGGRNGVKEASPPDDDGNYHHYDDDDRGQQRHGEGAGDDHARMRQQLAPLLAGGSNNSNMGGGHQKVGPRNGTSAMVPLDGGGRRGPNTRPSTQQQGAAYQRSQHSSSSYGDDNKSVRSGASSRASTKLGSAASYSTAGDSDAGSNFGSQRRANTPSVGWSRTETRLLMGLVDLEARNAREAMHGGFMWDAVAANLRQKLRQDPNLAARGLPQRRKAVDCRRRWDHCLKKAHATPKEQLTGEQKQWLVQYNDQRAWMASGGAGPTPDVRDASKEASREARRKNRKGGGGSSKAKGNLALIPEDLEVASKAEA